MKAAALAVLVLAVAARTRLTANVLGQPVSVPVLWLIAAASEALVDGSPPRVRGALPVPLRQCPRDRITPACTGSTRQARCSDPG